MIKALRRFYYRMIPTYKCLELKLFLYSEADQVIRENAGKPESEQWVIAPEEDKWIPSIIAPSVWLERRERIRG